MPARIDWKEQFDELTPLLQRGGVARVHYSGKRGAHTAFMDVLKTEYECRRDNEPWLSIRIDPQVYTVRYLPEIRAEFIRKLGISLPEATPANQTTSINMLSGIEAGGNANLTMSNVTIDLGAESHVHMTGARDRWVAALCGQIESYLKHGHLMVVLNHAAPKEQDEFWRHLWKAGLEKLVPAGLALVQLIDTSDAAGGVHDLAPQPHIEIHLPDVLSVGARAHAIDDITGILEKMPSGGPDDPRSWADAFVLSHYDDIPKLHARFAGYLMSRAQGTR